MSDLKRCERCGNQLPMSDLLGGRCPRCMVELGMESTLGVADPDLTHVDREGAPIIAGPSDVIGHYRILQLIGQGGMGAVYEAEQEHPRRTVALKIIKPGMASPEMLRRFEQEAQALGRLQHPGIAQIYEAGTADTGFGPQPYFAMELIHGATPRDYVRERNLSVRERLELVVKITDAVHHAHQRGLIHRDLKPTNILVDETGQPKVLDFGIARATDRDAQSTLQTDAGELVGTLAYMSPEQVSGDPREIDNRTDVYSLGVILFELLAGRLPYNTGRKLPEAIQAIREEDPMRLSVLDRVYRGDIETIAVKALEKDKSRRYTSAAEMAADIRRYLKDEPIVARPPSAKYQLQKFARRHKAVVSGIAAVFAVLVAGVIVSTQQAARARRAERSAVMERDRARQAETKANLERDRETTAEETARTQRDLALNAQQQATRERNRAVDAEEQTRLERDKAIGERQRADAAAAAARQQSLLNLWKSLSRESVRDSSNRLDGDRAALLARQAMLMHALTPNEPQYLVEDALQQAAHLDQWSHNVPLGAWPAAFSPDRIRLASGGRDFIVRVWDLRKPGVPAEIQFKGHQGQILAIAFSADGSHLASASVDKTVRVWDLRNPDAKPALFEGRQESVTSLAFSPDGSRLAGASVDRTARLWDLRNPGSTPMIFEGHLGAVNSVAFSPDGSRLATGSDIVRIWDLRNPGSAPMPFGSPLAAIPGIPPTTQQLLVNSVAFSPDGSRLAAGGADGVVRIWDTNNPDSPPAQLKGHQMNVWSVAFSPDGIRLASSSLDSTVRIWDARNPNVAPMILQGQLLLRSVAFSPDGKRLASAGADSLRLWDLSGSGSPDALFQGLPGEESVVLSSDGGRSASFQNGAVRVRDLSRPDAPPILIQTGQLGPFSALSADGRRFASPDATYAIRVWDVDHPDAPPLLLKGHQNFLLSLTFSRDGSLLASGSLDRSVRIWNVNNPNTPPVVVPLEGAQSIRSMAFSPDGSLLAFSSIDRLLLVDLRKPNAPPLTVLRGGTGSIPQAMSFSPDGLRLATADGVSQSVRVFDMRNISAAPVVLEGGHKDVVRSVAFSPDGWRIASASQDKTVRIWDLRKNEALPLVLDAPEGPANVVTFSADGTHLLAMNRLTVYAWPLWSTAADYLCTRVWRNLSLEEWRVYVGEDIPYERTCPVLPPGAGVQN